MHVQACMRMDRAAPKLHIRADSGRDVVHDVDVDVIEHDYRTLCISCALVHDVAEDYARFRGGHLQACTHRGQET